MKACGVFATGIALLILSGCGRGRISNATANGAGSNSSTTDSGSPSLSGQVLYMGISAPDTWSSIYNPSTNSFGPAVHTNPPSSSDGYLQATLLRNGKVLVTGTGKNPAELFDPANQEFTAIGYTAEFRSGGHTTTVLPNGEVLIAGGEGSSLNPDGSIPYLSSAELYDPQSGTFSITGSMSVPRAYATATLLGNGKVVIIGGSSDSGENCQPNVGCEFTNTFPRSIEIYNPATGVFSLAAANFPEGQGRYAFTTTPLPDGTLLIAGGIGGPDPITGWAILQTAFVYDPATDSMYSPVRMVNTHVGQSAILLPNGLVLIADSTAELYDPLAHTFSSETAPLAGGVAFPVLLPSGKILFANIDRQGEDPEVTWATEQYDPTIRSFELLGDFRTVLQTQTGFAVRAAILLP